MKIQKDIRIRMVAFAVATYVFSALAFANDTSHLIGKDLGTSRDTLTTAMKGRNYVVETDNQGKIKQVVDTGANGDGKEAQAESSYSAVANSASSATSVGLPENYQGQAALDHIGPDLPKIAEDYGLTPEKLEELLLADDTARIDSNNRIFYVEHEMTEQASSEATIAEATATEAPISTTNAPVVAFATANTFSLHSKPGASKTIYLDFDGHTAVSTAWNASYASGAAIVAPAFDLSGNPSVFDDNELTNIQKIWSRVSEDYLPFDVDVTTELPSDDALIRTSTADNSYGIRVVITKKGPINCSCGGIAYVGVVSRVNNSYYQPAWVFQDSLANNEKYIAEAAAHEAGHNLGLFHDGLSTTGYYSGHGAGETGWSSIMGVGYYKNVTQWNNGSYPGANNQQDDIAVFASNGILPRTDLVGNTFATASSLTNLNSGATVSLNTTGIIETATDVDMYMLNSAGGVINLNVIPAATGPNLDIKLVLYNSGGTVVAVSAPETLLSATLNVSLPADTYFLAVSGSAHASSGTDYGYPTYGSLGHYQISGFFPAANNAVPPTASLTTSTQTGPAALNVSFYGSNSIGNGNIVGYLWSFGDGTYSTQPNPVHTYTTVGTFTASLTVTNQYLLTSTKTTQISATAPPNPTVFAGSVTMNVKNASKAKKAAKVNANIVIQVVNSNGQVVPNAVVQGKWSGAFIGKLNGKTSNAGIVANSPNVKKTRKGGSGTFTINGINAPGYVYNPTRNDKSVVTVSW
jgi:PKD repeat protein